MSKEGAKGGDEGSLVDGRRDDAPDAGRVYAPSNELVLFHSAVSVALVSSSDQLGNV